MRAADHYSVLLKERALVPFGGRPDEDAHRDRGRAAALVHGLHRFLDLFLQTHHGLFGQPTEAAADGRGAPDDFFDSHVLHAAELPRADLRHRPHPGGGPCNSAQHGDLSDCKFENR